MRRIVLVVLTAAVMGSLKLPAQTQAPPPAAQGAGAKPAFQRASDALEKVTWRTRTLVGDARLTNWKFAVPANGVGVPTFLDAVVRADAAIVDYVEGSSTQKVSPQLQKNLDAGLTAEETATIRGRMGTVRMLTYRATLGADAGARRKVFELAKAMDVDTLVVPANTAIAGLDTLADEFSVNVAVLADSAKPSALVAALDGKSRRLGVGLDTGLLAQEGVATCRRRS